jgi:hypothetical protein
VISDDDRLRFVDGRPYENRLMDVLTVELAAAILDKPVGPFMATRVDLTIEHSTGLLTVKNCEGKPLSIHRFAITDARHFGIGEPHDLSDQQAAEVLAIACSLANSCVLFGTSQPTQLGSSVEKSRAPTKVEVIETPTEKKLNITETLTLNASLQVVLTTQLSISEKRIFDLAGKLLSIRIFNPYCRTRRERNVIDAISSYREALKSGGGLPCFMPLYAALEKTVNASKEFVGLDFDKEAAELSTVERKHIEELRQFHNRLKHAQREEEHLTKVQAGRDRLPALLQTLKRATDEAILKRI